MTRDLRVKRDLFRSNHPEFPSFYCQKDRILMEKVEDFVAKLTLDLSVKGHKKMITKAA